MRSLICSSLQAAVTNDLMEFCLRNDQAMFCVCTLVTSSVLCGIQGAARRLIRVAIEEGSRAGIRWLYVHAAEQNTAAIQLYTQRCGFQLEQEEGAGTAIRLNRPRRLLFRQCLV